jgi:hypothetical protein
MMAHEGMLIVRLRQPNRQRIHDAVLRTIDRMPEREWRNLLVVVRDAMISMSRSSEQLSS